MKRPHLGLQQQAKGLTHLLPDFRFQIKKGVLTGEAQFQPEPLSDYYRFKLQLAKGDLPRVWIIDPKLRLSEGAHRIPHTYDIDNPRPCLFRPQKDWDPSMPLWRTVIPWLAEWLFFYETWLSTGEWLGGGEHPGKRGKN